MGKEEDLKMNSTPDHELIRKSIGHLKYSWGIHNDNKQITKGNRQIIIVKTYMLKAGIDKVYRELILGHSLIGMDVHYLEPTDNDLKNAMRKYADWVGKNIL